MTGRRVSAGGPLVPPAPGQPRGRNGRVPGMPMSREQWTALSRESSYFGERAALMYLDGHLEPALEAANRAVRASAKLHENAPDSREAAEAFADGLRNRAEIQFALVRARAHDRPARAKKLARSGLRDAARVIDLYQQLHDDRFPLRPAEVMLLRSEFHGIVGEAGPARRYADLAIGDYRRHHRIGEEDSDLYLARALCRYARVMTAIETHKLALAAQRESVSLYRPHAGQGGGLWNRRFSRRTTWLSTPTLERFAQGAYGLATELGPPNPADAQEAMLALQDAAEGFAGLVRGSEPGLPLSAADVHFLRRTAEALSQQGGWLQAMGQSGLAGRYLQVARALATATGGWHEAVWLLRAPLLRVIGVPGRPAR